MNLQFLSNTTLFRGLQTDEIRSVLTCMNAQEKSYRKGEVLCRAGESVSSMGMILSGSVNIVVNYYWGGSNISDISAPANCLPNPTPPFPAGSCWQTL